MVAALLGFLSSGLGGPRGGFLTLHGRLKQTAVLRRLLGVQVKRIEPVGRGGVVAHELCHFVPVPGAMRVLGLCGERKA